MITPKAITDKCDFCDSAAVYDGKTVIGPWAYMCQAHFNCYGIKDTRLFTVLKQEPTPAKKCTKCNEIKPLTEFYKYTDHSGTERYRPECKACNLRDKQIKYKRSKENEQS